MSSPPSSTSFAAASLAPLAAVSSTNVTNHRTRASKRRSENNNNLSSRIAAPGVVNDDDQDDKKMSAAEVATTTGGENDVDNNGMGMEPMGYYDGDDNDDGNDSFEQQPKKKRRKTSKNKLFDDNKTVVMDAIGQALMPQCKVMWEQPTIRLLMPKKEHLGDGLEDKLTRKQKSDLANVAKSGGRLKSDYSGQQPHIQQLLERAATSKSVNCPSVYPYEGVQQPGDPYRTETITLVPTEIFDENKHKNSAWCTNCKDPFTCYQGKMQVNCVENHVQVCHPTKLPLDEEGNCLCGHHASTFKSGSRKGFIRHAQSCCNVGEMTGRQPHIQRFEKDPKCPNILPYEGPQDIGTPHRSAFYTIVPEAMYNEEKHKYCAFCTLCNKTVKIFKKGDSGNMNLCLQYANKHADSCIARNEEWEIVRQVDSRDTMCEECTQPACSVWKSNLGPQEYFYCQDCQTIQFDD